MKPVAVVAADLHFHHERPGARRGNWAETMENHLAELVDATRDLKVPLLLAGDIFHKPEQPPWLLNLLIPIFKTVEVHAIPGQHDLPQHNIDQIERSAYWTLVEAGAILDISDIGACCFEQHTIVCPFAWGEELRPDENRKEGDFTIALVHRYVWTKGTGHPNADVKDHVRSLAKIRKTYDMMVFGDNHMGFQSGNIFNCGAFIRRRVNEKDYQPRYGIICDDGSVKSISLKSAADDQWAEEIEEGIYDAGEFAIDLKNFDEGSGVDFEAVLRQQAVKADERVRDLLLGAIEDEGK